MKMLVALDRSAVSDRVLEMAKELAASLSGPVLLINVAPREADVLGHQVTRKVITEPVPADLRDRRDLLDRNAAILRDAGIDCETLLIRGDPGPTVVREAKRWDADLIVMGSHGRGALYRRFVGSVSEVVLTSRLLPVLIVPAQKATAATEG